MWEGAWAGLGTVVVAAIVLPATRGHAFQHLHLALLLPHEELHHQDLLLVDLKADVLGDVWYQPVHNVTHQHHHVLQTEHRRVRKQGHCDDLIIAEQRCIQK